MSLEPDVRDAINLGALLRSSERLQEAAAHYRQWVLSWPDTDLLLLNAANCIRDLGDPKQAIELIAKKLENQKKDRAATKPLLLQKSLEKEKINN